MLLLCVSIGRRTPQQHPDRALLCHAAVQHRNPDLDPEGGPQLLQAREGSGAGDSEALRVASG